MVLDGASEGPRGGPLASLLHLSEHMLGLHTGCSLKEGFPVSKIRGQNSRHSSA